MVKLTKLNGEKIFVNSHYLVLIEKTPDTVITLIDGAKILVKETPEEILSAATEKNIKGQAWTELR